MANMSKMEIIPHEATQGYVRPSTRCIRFNAEVFFLLSNTETIIGGDDPEIDW